MKIIQPSFEVLDHLDAESLPVRLEYCGRICYKSEHRIRRETAIPFVVKMAKHGHNSVLEMAAVSLRLSCSRQDMAALYATLPRYLQIDEIEDNILLLSGSVRAFREIFIHCPENPVIRAAAARIGRNNNWFFSGQTGVKEGEGELVAEQVGLEQINDLPADLLLRHRHIAVKFIINRAVSHEIVRHRPCSFLQESQRYCCYGDDRFGSEVTFIKPMFFAEGSEEYSLWEQAMAETEKLYLQLLKTSSPQAARTVLPNSCKTEIIVYANLEEWRHIFSLRTTKAAEPSMREVMIPLFEDFQQRFPKAFA